MTKNSVIPVIPSLLADMGSAGVPALQELHSQMLATASDLGYEPIAEVLVEIEDEATGREVCERLHAGLTEHHERMLLAKGGNAGDTDAQHGKKKSAGTAKSPAKSKKPKAAAEKAPTADTQKEDTVATTPKKSVAKKAPAKKAKKAPAKKAAKKAAKGTRGVDENAKIAWIRTKEGNGAREGTSRHERRELLRKANGKTVKTYLAGGGNTATLKRAVKDKDVRLEGGASA